jgi:hypothetical protein
LSASGEEVRRDTNERTKTKKKKKKAVFAGAKKEELEENSHRKLPYRQKEIQFIRRGRHAVIFMRLR